VFRQDRVGEVSVLHEDRITDTLVDAIRSICCGPELRDNDKIIAGNQHVAAQQRHVMAEPAATELCVRWMENVSAGTKRCEQLGVPVDHLDATGGRIICWTQIDDPAHRHGTPLRRGR
jgi:hypothetical protein